MTSVRRVRVAVAAAIAALVLAATALAAGGSTAASIRNRPNLGSGTGTAASELPRVPGALYLSLSPGDFAPDSIRFENQRDYFNQWGFSGTPAGPELSNDDFGRCFNASVHLSRGSTMTAIVFYYRSGPRTDLYATLLRQNLAAGTTDRFVEISPTDNSGQLKSVTVLIPSGKGVIDNQRYAYAVGVCPVRDSTFNGAKIQYVVT